MRQTILNIKLREKFIKKGVKMIAPETVFFSKDTRDEKDLNYSLSLITKYNIINACYQKAQHYINLASNSLSVFNDCEEKNILENLTSFSLTRNF